MSAGERGSVAIVGAGTMGAGIAQVAATSGWTTLLMDVDEATARGAVERIAAQLERLVEKGKITREDASAAVGRLGVAAAPEDLRSCELLIEAVVEDLAVKTAVLGRLLPALPADAIIATNTSSLSVSALGEAIGEPQRTLGMHFFNPAPLMLLVEIIAGAHTEPALVDRAAAIAEGFGKKVARAADVPGFIVNHVARPYYLEAFRMLEEGVAGPRAIDRAMTALGGFRMGPLELTDLIGQDVNSATTRSVWEQLGRPALLRPSPLQERLVAGGHLGRKSGRGVYAYATAEPVPAVEIERQPLPLAGPLRAAVDDFVVAAVPDAAASRPDDPLEWYIFARILVAIIAQAAHAHARSVAGTADIDTALRYGTNYPRGPFEWAARIGHERCAALLEALRESTADERFAVPGIIAARARR